MPFLVAYSPCCQSKRSHGFRILGVNINLEDSSYTSPADQKRMDIGIQWTAEMEWLMQPGHIKAYPFQELPGAWESIIEELGLLRKGKVRGQKLVMKIPQQ